MCIRDRQTPADVVITDMRMPGMDGAELLRHIQRDFPAAARIVLSGQAERESIMRALPVTHQFLHKPCDGDTLRAVIEQTHALHKLCLLYTSDAADERSSVDLGGRRIIKKKK